MKKVKQPFETINFVPYPFLPPKNGGHYYAFHLSRYLDQLMEVKHLGSADNIMDQKAFAITSFFKESKLKYINPFLAFALWRLVTKNKIKNLIVHQPFMGIVLLPIFIFTKVKVYIVVHNIEFSRFESLGKWWAGWLKYLEVNLFKRAEGLFFISTIELEIAVTKLLLPASKCHLVPYGTDLENVPLYPEGNNKYLVTEYGLSDNCFVMLFFGPMGYAPNLEAVEFIVEELVPAMRDRARFPFHIFICGGGLPKEYNHFKEVAEIGLLGYVPEIAPFIKGADLVLNPIFSGGGVKTKVIEALSQGKIVLSFETGALGIDQSVTGDQLITVEDQDVAAYVAKILSVRKGEIGQRGLPMTFYEQHNWLRIAHHIKDVLACV